MKDRGEWKEGSGESRCPHRLDDPEGHPEGCRGVGRTTGGGLFFLHKWCREGRWRDCPAYHWHLGRSAIPEKPAAQA